MANTPTPRSYAQIVGEMTDSFLSRIGLPGLKKAAPVLSLIEVAAQSDLRGSQDIFTLLANDSLKRSKGLALDRKGADERVFRVAESPSSGKVNITDTSFVKKSTRVSQAQPVPIAGSTTLNVVDASSLPATGSVYVGRGTANFEGPLAYNAVINNGTHYSLSLTSPTLRFHNQNEPVVLAQGGHRLVAAGTVVRTPQGAARDAVSFATLYSATIPDGETTVTNVLVVCQIPGTAGNVAAKSIKEFASAPFAGAAVTNPLPFTNGLSTQPDPDYAESIATAKQTRTKGTPLAIRTAAIGTTSADENKRVVSAAYVRGQDGRPDVLYIDDGTGYEERSQGVALESLTDLALGGEEKFELVNRPVQKACLTTTLTAPFALTPGAKLAFAVGGVVTVHTFDSSSFRNISSCAAWEVVASINSNSLLLWSARTADGGTRIVVFAKNDANEDIEWVDTDAAITPAVITPNFGNQVIATPPEVLMNAPIKVDAPGLAPVAGPDLYFPVARTVTLRAMLGCLGANTATLTFYNHATGASLGTISKLGPLGEVQGTIAMPQGWVEVVLTCNNAGDTAQLRGLYY